MNIFSLKAFGIAASEADLKQVNDEIFRKSGTGLTTE